LQFWLNKKLNSPFQVTSMGNVGEIFEDSLEVWNFIQLGCFFFLQCSRSLKFCNRAEPLTKIELYLSGETHMFSRVGWKGTFFEIAPKNFCILFFPDLATKPLNILWFGLKLTILLIFHRNGIFLMIFCLFRIESLKCYKKTLESKP
jgi:hypothetical protein